ncbi:MAG: hypothetical protein WDN46_22995 [Methylocella sp.]
MSTIGKWQWWASTDGENYDVGPHDCREDLIAELDAERDIGMTFTITEAQQGSYNYRVMSGPGIIEKIEDRNEERSSYENGETVFDAVADNILAELTNSVNDAIEDWVRIHQLEKPAAVFSAMRNESTHTVPALSGDA